MIYIIIIIIIILCAAISIFASKKRKQENIKKQKEINTMTIIDKTTFKRAEIDTSYIQKQLFSDIQQFVLANYTLNENYLPNTMFPSFYKETYDNIIREKNLNIKKNINNFNMEKARVVKQDNSTMYSVTKLIVEGTFFLDYYYNHPTINKHILKKFTQRFVFFNNQNNWQLQNIEKEDILDIKDISTMEMKIL